MSEPVLTPLGVQVPAKWEIRTIGELCTKIRSGATPKGGSAVYISAGVSFIRSQNVFDHRFSFDGLVYTDESTAEKLSGASVNPGDVLLNITGDGETIARCCVAPSEVVPARVNQHVMILRPGSELDSGYLQRYLSQPAMRDYMLNHNSGGSRRALTKGMVSKFDIMLPSLSEQEAIARVFKALDDKIAVNDRIAQMTLDLAEAIYLQSVRSEYWRELSLGQAAKWFSGGTPKTSEAAYWGGDIPWISASSLKNPWVFESDRSVTELGAQNGTRLVDRDAILFVVRGMSLASEFRVGIAQRKLAFGQDCKALSAIEGVDAATLFLALRSRTQEILGLVDYAGHGTGKLATDRIAQLPVDLPQAGTATDGFAEKVRPLLDRGFAANIENRSLSALRDTLLPRLMSGELRVKDAEKAVEEAT